MGSLHSVGYLTNQPRSRKALPDSDRGHLKAARVLKATRQRGHFNKQKFAGPELTLAKATTKRNDFITFHKTCTNGMKQGIEEPSSAFLPHGHAARAARPAPGTIVVACAPSCANRAQNRAVGSAHCGTGEVASRAAGAPTHLRHNTACAPVKSRAQQLAIQTRTLRCRHPDTSSGAGTSRPRSAPNPVQPQVCAHANSSAYPHSPDARRPGSLHPLRNRN